MRRWLGIALALAALGATVLAEHTWRLRRAKGEIAETLFAADRFVDFGVRLLVVKQDPNGRQLLKGKPRLTILREHRRGGIYDTRKGRFIGASRAPVTWLVSEASEPLVLHGDDLPLRLCVEGAMGAGKSTTLVQWVGLRAIEHTATGGEIGVTAPTTPRLLEIKRALLDLFPAQWHTWKERDQTLTLANGVVIRLVSTHQASAAEGSPIQGFNWVASANDEIQDSLNVDGDIEARGRDAPNGRYKRLATATVKDAPSYRSWRDRLKLTDVWGFYRMSGLDSPFVVPDYWEQLRSTMTEREFQRKVLAQDLPSESRVYYAFEREQNMFPTPLPTSGVRDVTRSLLNRYGGGQLLIGHDPGRIYDVSVILQAFQVPGQRDPVWYVVGEVTTQQASTQTHVRQLRELLDKRFGLRAEDVLVKADPFTKNHRDDDQPHQTVYTVWKQHGFRIQPAAYKTASTDAAQVPRQARIDMVNTLLCSATNERRLMIACDDRRQPMAPQLVKAFESMELDAAGRPERDRKGADDMSHWPAALGYALWTFERPRLNGGPAREVLS